MKLTKSDIRQKRAELVEVLLKIEKLKNDKASIEKTLAVDFEQAIHDLGVPAGPAGARPVATVPLFHAIEVADPEPPVGSLEHRGGGVAAGEGLQRAVEYPRRAGGRRGPRSPGWRAPWRRSRARCRTAGSRPVRKGVSPTRTRPREPSRGCCRQ